MASGGNNKIRIPCRNPMMNSGFDAATLLTHNGHDWAKLQAVAALKAATPAIPFANFEAQFFIFRLTAAVAA